jgi:putative hydrolase of the HAD superfamily
LEKILVIKTIIFDFGNVVGFFDPEPALERLAKFTPLTTDAILEFFSDRELEEAYETGQMSSADFLRQVRRGCQVSCSDEVLTTIYSEIFWPNEEVCTLIPLLKGPYRLLLGSNTSELHSQQFCRQFAETLRHFHALVLSWEIGTRKPRPEFYQHCLLLAGCAPDECLFIDDLPANVAGAQAGGLHGLVYRPGDNLPRRLAEFGIHLNGQVSEPQLGRLL